MNFSNGALRFLFGLVNLVVGLFVALTLANVFAIKPNDLPGSIFFFGLWVGWVVLTVFLSFYLFRPRTNQITREEVLICLWGQLFWVIPFLSSVLIPFMPNAGTYTFWGNMAGNSFYVGGLMFIVTFFYMSGYKQISPSELVIYPLQFLTLQELEEAIEKIEKRWLTTLVSIAIFVVALMIGNYLYPWTNWISLIISICVPLSTGYYSKKYRINYVKGRIAELETSSNINE